MITLPTAAGATTEYEDFYETTLLNPVTAADTDIYPTVLPSSAVGFLVMDPLGANPEIIFYNFKGANFVRVPSVIDGEGRGVGNTTPRGYDAGTKIGMYSIAEYFEGLANGRFMRDGFLQSRHFSSSIDPNSWIGTGEAWNWVQYLGEREGQYVTAGDKTTKYARGMKVRLPRVTAVGTQSAKFVRASTQYASKAAPTGHAFTTKYTVLAKVWIDSLPSGGYNIFSRRDATGGWSIDLDTNGTVTIRARNGANEKNGNGKIGVNLKQWVTIAATMDASAGANWSTVYIDGHAIPTNQNIAGAVASIVQSGNLQIGAAESVNTFDGLISEVALFSDVLSAATILSYSNKQLTGSEPTIVAYYKLDGNFNDSTANANHLTAAGGAIATYADNPFKATEYGIITNMSFAAGNTTINVWSGRNHHPVAENLSGISYSAARNPVGFPGSRAAWTHERRIGGTYSTSGGGYQNPGGFCIILPSGEFDTVATLGYQTVTTDFVLGISTSATAPVEIDCITRPYLTGAPLRLDSRRFEHTYDNATQTTVYAITKGDGAAYDLRGDATPHMSIIKAVPSWM